MIELFNFHDLTEVSGLSQDIHGTSGFAQTFFNVVSDVLLSSVETGTLFTPVFEKLSALDLDTGFDKTLVMPSVIAEFLTTVKFVPGAVDPVVEATKEYPYTQPPKAKGAGDDDSSYSMYGMYNYVFGTDSAQKGIKGIADAMQAKLDAVPEKPDDASN